MGHESVEIRTFTPKDSLGPTDPVGASNETCSLQAPRESRILPWSESEAIELDDDSLPTDTREGGGGGTIDTIEGATGCWITRSVVGALPPPSADFFVASFVVFIVFPLHYLTLIAEQRPLKWFKRLVGGSL